MATIYQNGIQYSGSGEPLIYDDMGGATSTTGGVHGLVPAPSAGDNEKFLSGDRSHRVNLWESNWVDAVGKMWDDFIYSHFTEEGIDWINYYFFASFVPHVL